MPTMKEKILGCSTCDHVFEPKEKKYYDRYDKPPREPMCGRCLEDYYGIDLDEVPEEPRRRK